MTLEDLIPEIKSAGYQPLEGDGEILIIPPGYHDMQGAIGVKDGRLYYRIAPLRWFSTQEDRDNLEGFLKMLLEVHRQKKFDDQENEILKLWNSFKG